MQIDLPACSAACCTEKPGQPLRDCLFDGTNRMAGYRARVRPDEAVGSLHLAGSLFSPVATIRGAIGRPVNCQSGIGVALTVQL